MVSLYLKEKGLASSGGEISEKIIDRSEELYSMKLLHKAGLGPPIHAQLSNGLCYGLLPGKDGIGGGAVGGNLAEGGVMVALHSVEIPGYFQKFEATGLGQGKENWTGKLQAHHGRRVEGLLKNFLGEDNVGMSLPCNVLHITRV